jgi:hypothetical protein
MKPTAFHLAMTMLVGTAACGFQEELNSCIDDRATIEQGVYGQLLNGCDTDDCTWSYAVGMGVRVYDANPTPASGPQDQGIYDTGTGLTPISRTTSGVEGFYELALSPATYYLCTNNCSEVILSALQPRIRSDWASGPDGGIWWAGSCPTQ